MALLASTSTLRRDCAAAPSGPPICGVRSKRQHVRIAAGFYGAHRSTPLTVASIRKNLLGPLHKVADGAVDVFVHAMIVRHLDGGHHVAEQEGFELCTEDYLLLRGCVSDTHDQDSADAAFRMREIADSGVFSVSSTTGFRNLTGPFPRMAPPAIANASVRLNIVRSRFSLKQVSRLIEQREQSTRIRYTHVVLARPDTGFATPLEWKLPPGYLPANHLWLRVPNFQHGYGVNDRFAYGSRDAMMLYAREVRRVATSYRAPTRP